LQTGIKKIQTLRNLTQRLYFLSVPFKNIAEGDCIIVIRNL